MENCYAIELQKNVNSDRIIFLEYTVCIIAHKSHKPPSWCFSGFSTAKTTAVFSYLMVFSTTIIMQKQISAAPIPATAYRAEYTVSGPPE